MVMRSIGFALVFAGLLGGCSWFGGPAQTETDTDAIKRAEDPYHVDPKYTGVTMYNAKTQEGQDSGLLMHMLFGTGSNGNGNGNGSGNGNGHGNGLGVGVNSYLWHATLDTVSFMPLASADPFGGVIITDWYSPPENQSERVKVNILILGRELRADGLRCTVFRQKRDPGGQWADAPVEAKTAAELENAILTRARQLRLNTTAAK